MTLEPGTQLAHYEILTPIGAGGMGEVYLAQDTRLERKVAIKILSREFNESDDRLRRFTQEARAVSALNHPNIITIHEIGETNHSHFIATEYIEGKTLRQHLTAARLGLSEALDIATQIAGALAAAHQAGIIHRDVKPENVMLRPDGYVKVLDFGLAKLMEKSGSQSLSPSADGATVLNDITEPGVLMGTVRYMSPEQARAREVDERTDIFSFGVLLYEMLAGRRPFDGESPIDTLTAILHHEPAPLAEYLPAAPAELQRIVHKTLRKDREDRYQTMKEVFVDLKNVKEELQIRSKLERSGSRRSARQQATDNRTQSLGSGLTQDALAVHQTPQTVQAHSQTEALPPRRQGFGRGVLFGLTVTVLMGVATFFYVNRQPALTEQDTVLVADFINTTGDPIFDGTLKQGLAVQLQQSPFFNLFPDVRARETLRRMNRSPDERVSVEVGREICERQGLKALIVGTIAPLGSHYVITLEAINGRSGEGLASEQTEAESKEEVLKALGRAASRLREKLGENLSSIQKFDAPLEATTSSLEALKAFSQGVEQSQQGKFFEAIPFYLRALELDPNFAYAYGTLAVNYNNTRQPARAAENATRAFNLRERMSELEKLRITSFYYALVTGEIEKGIETLELYRRTYPRDERGPLNLADRYNTIGQFEKAVVQAREALRLNPNNAIGYWNLADALLRLNRFGEAREICEQAIQQNLDATALHGFLYQLAFAEGDAMAMQRQLDWASGRADEYVALDWQAAAAAFNGEWQRAQEFSRQAAGLATRSSAREVAARYAAEALLRGAALGDCKEVLAAAAPALLLERNQVSLTRVALALALCGESVQALSLAEELSRRYAKDTLINGIWLPCIRAAVELGRGNAGEALELLEPARRYEAAAEFWTKYLRGHAYLRQRDRVAAAIEFQNIIAHRGEATLSVLYPLAHLGLARAEALGSDPARARQAYQDFLALWKNADQMLPVLLDAQREFEKLR